MSVIEHDLGDITADLNPDQITLALRRLTRRNALDLVADLGLDQCVHCERQRTIDDRGVERIWRKGRWGR